jgi:putative hemolysin
MRNDFSKHENIDIGVQFPTEKDRLIDLRDSLPASFASLQLSPFIHWLERVLAIDTCNAIYRAVSNEAKEGANFFEETLKQLDVRYEIRDEDLLQIPKRGPLLVVANHPFGAVDGLLLGALLSRVRPDMRILVNHLLNRVEPMRRWNIGIDPFGGNGSRLSNQSGMRDCLRWLRQGGVMATFPAGTVSHIQLSKGGRVEDPSWSPHMAMFAMRCKVPVLPIYFSGRNSALFQSAGVVNHRLRTLLLPEEMVRLRGKTIPVRIGKVIAVKEIEKFASAEECTDYLRQRTYLLGYRKLKPTIAKKKTYFLPTPRRNKWIMESVANKTLQDKIDTLSDDCELIRSGDFSVYCASANQIGPILRQIGIVRERTFRSVGEGTGTSIDLDCFDEWYEHLFLWDHAKNELAGAYRLGRVDEILSKHGVKGLYTATLFQFKKGYLNKLPPALELGRSFVAEDYQRRRGALALIWRGIGEYIMRNPKYRYLIGPVSISNEYQVLSRDLIIQFLRRHQSLKDKRIRPRHAPRAHRFQGLNLERLFDVVDDMDIVDVLVSEIEPDGRGIPVLLRHYLKLNARILGFNVDQAFSNVVDGLIQVDLLAVDKTLLKRYLGDKGAAVFSSFQQQLQKNSAFT